MPPPPQSRENGNSIPLPGVQPSDSEPRESQAIPGQDIANEETGWLSASQEQVLQPGQSQSEWSAPEIPQVERLPEDHSAVSDLTLESPLRPDQPGDGDSINALEANFTRDEPNALRKSPSEPTRIAEPAEPAGSAQLSSLRYTEGNATPAALSNTLLHNIEATSMHVEQSVISQGNRPVAFAQTAMISSDKQKGDGISDTR